MAGKPWTAEEDRIFRSRYRELGPRGLMELLPGRSAVAIQLRAGQTGLTQKPQVWREGQRQCPRCSEWKPLAEFGTNRHAKNGKHWYCKACVCFFNKKHRQNRYPWHLQRDYGLNLEQFEQLYLHQKGLCAICHDPIFVPQRGRGQGNVTVCVDHDHITGKVRGLLCSRCNSGIGMFRDDPDLLEAARDYLSDAVITPAQDETPEQNENCRQKESINGSE